MKRAYFATSKASGPIGGVVVLTMVSLTPAFLAGCQGDDGNGTETADTTSVSGAITATGGVPWVSRVGLTNAQYQSELTNWVNAGYRPTYISGYVVNNQDYYAAIWEKSNVQGWIAHHAMTAAGFAQQITANAAAGYRLVMANGYTLNGTDLYVAIWEYGTMPLVIAKYPLTASQVSSLVTSEAQTGYRAMQISGYGAGTEEFLVLFQKTNGPTQLVRTGQTAIAFNSEYTSDIPAGYHLSQFNAYSMSGTTHYVSIFDLGSSSVPQQRGIQMYQDGYQQSVIDLGYQGYRPVNISGGIAGLQVVNGTPKTITLPQFAVLWQNYVMTASDLNYIDQAVKNVTNKTLTPSISLAVAKNGRLVFAKAYGNAQVANSVVSAVPATTASVYRLASISKAITSTAVLWLADHGYLSIDDYVFGSNSIFGANNYPYPNPGCRGTGVPCVEDIKVNDLLSMTAGGWCSDTGSNDPPLSAMFNACNDTCADENACEDGIISWTLANQRLDVKTDTKYGYSNFNYILLAKIIAAVTHQLYADWVQQNILIPFGVTDMQIGNNALNQRISDEVEYYPASTGTRCDGNDPYQWNLHVMEGNGGWVGSPIDLVRFMGHVDGLSSVPEFLLAGTQRAMITDQAWLLTNHQSDGNYGMGWYLTQNSGDINSDPTCTADRDMGQPACMQFGNGDLTPGTNTEMGSTHGGTSWAIVANLALGNTKTDPSCVDPPRPQPQCPRYSLYEDIARPVLNNVTAWPGPSYDLFQQPNLAFYDPPTPGAPSYQCTVGNTTMHCCPPGSVMIGADANGNVFKCAPVLTTGTLALDPAPGGSAYQCNGMHCCPPNQVMVGLRSDQNILACMPLPSGSITTQRVDYKTLVTATADANPIHVCDAATPVAAMAGIDVAGDRLTCATDPHLQ